MNNSNRLAIAENLHPSPPQGIVLLSARELDKMRHAGQLAAHLLKHLEAMIEPGVSTQMLNDEAERWTRIHGAISAQLGGSAI